MLTREPSIAGLHEIVNHKQLPDTHGARRYFTFLSMGPGAVRNFVQELGVSVEQPYLDNYAGVDTWLAMMDSLFGNMPSNLNTTMTIAWVTRRFIALGLTEAVVNESKAHSRNISSEVAAIVKREGQKERKPKGHGGMSGGSGFTYTPKA